MKPIRFLLALMCLTLCLGATALADVVYLPDPGDLTDAVVTYTQDGVVSDPLDASRYQTAQPAPGILALDLDGLTAADLDRVTVSLPNGNPACESVIAYAPQAAAESLHAINITVQGMPAQYGYYVTLSAPESDEDAPINYASMTFSNLSSYLRDGETYTFPAPPRFLLQIYTYDGSGEFLQMEDIPSVFRQLIDLTDLAEGASTEQLISAYTGYSLNLQITFTKGSTLR